MNKRIGRLGMAITAAFIILVVNLTYVQFFAASELAAKPQNIRPLLFEKRIQRGRIISADGQVLASNRKVDNGYERLYPFAGLAAPVTGFYSTKYGRSGLELSFDEYLSGQSKISSVDGYIKRLLGKNAPGHDIVLTLDMKLQKLAMQALGNKKGAVVVLNPKTGAVLALASQPTYNPNRIDEDWPALSASADGVLLNRALQGRFAPGSAFKIVTTAAALADGQVTTDTVFDAPANLKIYGGKVTNYEGKGYGKMTLADAFAKSVNTVFAQVGKTLGGKKLAGAAGAFGLDGKTPFDIATAASSVPSASDMDELEVSWMAVGQGRLQLTPLNVALVGAAIANGGKIMQPYLVQEVKEHSGTTIFKRAPKVWKNPISPEVADSLRTLMEKVVEQGTGKAAKIDGVEVAGKTGTAEVENKAPHAWFVGFAPAGDPQAVVAVIVENGGTGGKVAAPIAKEILAAALGKNR